MSLYLTIILIAGSPYEGLEDEDVEFYPPDSADKVESQFGDFAPVGQEFVQPFWNNWIFMGPMPITNEPWSDGTVSGRVVFVLPHPTNQNIVYIAAAQGGVWKTTDGGNNWMPLTDGLTSLASGALAFQPGDPNTIWYGTGEMNFCGDCSSGDGLFKSTDAGNTWTKVAARTTVGSYIARIYIHPTNPNIIVMATSGCIVRSTNGGTSWTQPLAVSWARDLVADPTNPDELYCTVWQNGIYRSTDAGATWNQLTNGLPAAGTYTRVNIAISQSNPNVLYAGYSNNSYTLLGFYRTTNGGTNWSQIAGVPDYLCGQGFYNHMIIVDQTNSDTIYAGGTYPYNASYRGLIRTTNGGTSWTDITDRTPNGCLHPDIHHMAWDAAGHLWVGCDGGVWESTNNGNSWINHNATLGITQFYTVAVSSVNDLIIQGGTQDNGTPRTETGGLPWFEFMSGDGGPTNFDWGASAAISYTTYVYLDPLYKWNGTTFQFGIGGLSGDGRVSWCNGPLETDPNTINRVYAGTYRVWRSTDGGSNWGTISGGLTGGSGYLLSLEIAPGNSNIIYTGASSGRFYYTSNGGGAWNNRTNAAWGANEIRDLRINPSNNQEVYVALSNVAVYRTTNAGSAWTNVTGDLGTLDVREVFSMVVDFSSNPRHIYVGTKHGVYGSQDGGTTWSKTANLPMLDVYELWLDSDVTGNYLLAATHGRGIWKTYDVLYEDVTEPGDTPGEGHPLLYAGGWLYYSLPDAGADVRVYDVLGRMAWERSLAGDGRVRLELGTGVYFARAQGGAACKLVVME
jgi:photosystem II stability/assembly factor-like uncharacterized protein